MFSLSPSCLAVLSSLTFSTVSSQLLFHPIWQASDQPPLSPPFTAEHPLEHGVKKNTMQQIKQKATVLSPVQCKDTTNAGTRTERAIFNLQQCEQSV